MDFVAFGETLGEGSTLRVFTMSQSHPWTFRGQGLEPFQQVGLTGMGTESTQGMNVGFNGDPFAKNGHHLFAVHQLTSESSVALISDDQNVTSRPPQIIPEVMQNSACVAHTRSGQDQQRTHLLVDPFGFLR